MLWAAVITAAKAVAAVIARAEDVAAVTAVVEAMGVSLPGLRPWGLSLPWLRPERRLSLALRLGVMLRTKWRLIISAIKRRGLRIDMHSG